MVVDYTKSLSVVTSTRAEGRHANLRCGASSGGGGVSMVTGISVGIMYY